MKSKLKLGDFILLLGTVAVFLLSIFLWIFIMVNDQYFSHVEQTSSVTEHSRSRIVYNLYIPTSSYSYQNGQLYRLYDAKKNLPIEFIRELKNTKYQGVEKISTSPKKYEQLLNNHDNLQLTFPNEVSMNLFTKTSPQKNEPKFRRVFVTASDRYLYLGNDRTYTIYRVNFTKADFSRLRKYARNAHGRSPVELVRLKDGYEVFYTKLGHWRVYSYLTNSQTDSYFVSRLFGTSNVTSSSNKKGWTTYALNYYTKLRVPDAKSKHHNFLYSRYEKQKSESTSKRQLDSVEYVHKLGLSEQDLRYFDTVGNSVSYINYIEGIPVFLDSHNPQVKATFLQDEVELAFNNIDLQIPIPFDGQMRTLPTSGEVMKKMLNVGLKRSEIQRVIVAYRVEQDNTRNNLINLVPIYYVKAYNQWKSVVEWAKQDPNALAKLHQAMAKEEK
ncbi:hypothetical protein [Lactobacillus xylocopicola]|uniref:Regulatory protein YycH domain-containing protein n=1 Tax=Lactobacillus xylocopicola TaxID=2976676 RepID=A0ABN6SJN3_9LACO|nr:hypothetical protein [Lactobacillus xylocopicola]BDR59833.1 hypothetical protein KIM322_00940 [Lactobacillus xylocopicola]